MITEAQKQRIMEAIAANRANYPSDAKHAASLGITTSVYSAVKNGQTDKVLSDANWIGIARRLGVNLRGGMEWKAAKTPTFEYITSQLEISQKSVPAALKDVGFRTIKAFGAKSRFFHCEFFRLNEDKPGLGKKGDYVALEVNMRPAGGYTPDMINYANSVDCYQIWADMVCYDELRHEKLDLPHHYCVYAGRRDCHTYKHSHEEILARYGRQMKMCDRVPDVLSLDMGNQMYVATLDTATERDAFVRYVQEQAPAQAAKD